MIQGIVERVMKELTGVGTTDDVLWWCLQQAHPMAVVPRFARWGNGRDVTAHRVLELCARRAQRRTQGLAKGESRFYRPPTSRDGEVEYKAGEQRPVVITERARPGSTRECLSLAVLTA